MIFARDPDKRIHIILNADGLYTLVSLQVKLNPKHLPSLALVLCNNKWPELYLCERQSN